jgi:hypothetical protein
MKICLIASRDVTDVTLKNSSVGGKISNLA